MILKSKIIFRFMCLAQAYMIIKWMCSKKQPAMHDSPRCQRHDRPAGSYSPFPPVENILPAFRIQADPAIKVKRSMAAWQPSG